MLLCDCLNSFVNIKTEQTALKNMWRQLSSSSAAMHDGKAAADGSAAVCGAVSALVFVPLQPDWELEPTPVRNQAATQDTAATCVLVSGDLTAFTAAGAEPARRCEGPTATLRTEDRHEDRQAAQTRLLLSALGGQASPLQLSALFQLFDPGRQAAA